MVFCITIGIGVIINSRKIFMTAAAAEYDSNCREVICEYVGAIKGLVVLCYVIMIYWPFLSLVRCRDVNGLVQSVLVQSSSVRSLEPDCELEPIGPIGLRSYRSVL